MLEMWFRICCHLSAWRQAVSILLKGLAWNAASSSSAFDLDVRRPSY